MKKTFIVILTFLITIKFSDLLFSLINDIYKLDNTIEKSERFLVLREYEPGQIISIAPTDDYLLFTDSLIKKNYSVSIDSKGFISNGNIVNEDSNLKILFLGGSTTETLYVDERSRFPSVVERILRVKLQTSVSTYNGGVSGNKSMHSLLILLGKGIPLNLDYAVLMHNINDMTLLSRTESYWISPKTRELVKSPSKKSNFSLSIDNFFKNIKDALFPNLYSYIKPRLIKKNKNEFDTYARKPLSSKLKNKIYQSWRASLKSYIDICRSWNIKPILMTQFNRINEQDVLFNSTFLQAVAPNADLNKKDFIEVYKTFNEITRDVATKEDVILIDLENLLPATDAYIFDSVHLNSNGSILVGEIISDYLINDIQIK